MNWTSVCNKLACGLDGTVKLQPRERTHARNVQWRIVANQAIKTTVREPAKGTSSITSTTLAICELFGSVMCVPRCGVFMVPPVIVARSR